LRLGEINKREESIRENLFGMKEEMRSQGLE